MVAVIFFFNVNEFFKKNNGNMPQFPIFNRALKIKTLNFVHFKAD